MNEATQALKKALKNKKRDYFEDGEVIRWKAGGKYTYVALKAGGRWWITGRVNQYGGQVFVYDELLKILSLADVTEVAVATEWEELE